MSQDDGYKGSYKIPGFLQQPLSRGNARKQTTTARHSKSAGDQGLGTGKKCAL